MRNFLIALAKSVALVLAVILFVAGLYWLLSYNIAAGLSFTVAFLVAFCMTAFWNPRR